MTGCFNISENYAYIHMHNYCHMHVYISGRSAITANREIRTQARHRRGQNWRRRTHFNPTNPRELPEISVRVFVYSALFYARGGAHFKVNAQIRQVASRERGGGSCR